MDETFDEQYPNIAWWVQTDSGWIEVGSDEFIGQWREENG